MLPAVTDPAPATDQARLEEFKILRGEIELRAAEQRSMERYVILADAAIYSVLMFPKDEAPDALLVDLGWVLPPVIGFLALIRWRESVTMIETLAEFLRRRERELFGPAGSWEWFLHGEKRAHGAIGLFSFWYTVYWAVVIGATGALAGYKLAATAGIRPWTAAATGLVLTAIVAWMMKTGPRASYSPPAID